MSPVNSGVSGPNFTKFSTIYRHHCTVNAPIEVVTSHSVSECQSDESGEFAIFCTKSVVMGTSLDVLNIEV